MVIGFSDYAFYLSIGKYGFNIGPWYLMITKDEDQLYMWGKVNNSHLCNFTFHHEFFQKEYTGAPEE